MFTEPREIKAIQQADGAVPAPCAEDGLDVGTVEVALQQGGSVLNCAGKTVKFLIEAVGNEDNETVALKELHGRLYLFGQHFCRRGNDGDSVTIDEARHRLRMERERDNY